MEERVSLTLSPPFPPEPEWLLRLDREVALLPAPPPLLLLLLLLLPWRWPLPCLATLCRLRARRLSAWVTLSRAEREPGEGAGEEAVGFVVTEEELCWC